MENVKIINNGSLEYTENDREYSANFTLLIIRRAWDCGCDFEREADGFGPGRGTLGDWSGIRDSSDEAKTKMLVKALEFGFPSRPRFRNSL